jgi:hypothetical protein
MNDEIFLAACPKGRAFSASNRSQLGPSGMPLKKEPASMIYCPIAAVAQSLSI